MNVPEPDIGVYLDTNVLIDLIEGLDPTWRPGTSSKTEAQRVAAVRLFFYGYRDRNGWYLVISGEGRNELTARGAPDWTLSVFFDIDASSDPPSTAEVESLAGEWIERVGLGRADALHLARAWLHGWIRFFVTNDQTLIKRARRLKLPGQLEVITAVEAEALLDIAPGEPPPIEPAPDSPLASVHHWWIP